MTPYFIGIYRKTIKPHVFSWFIWTLIIGIDWAAQYSKEAGPGAWCTGFSALVAFLVTIFSLKYGEKNITRSDWISFFAALTSILLWLLTKDPLWSVIIVSIINALAFYPTFRKSWHKPYEEGALLFILDGLSFGLSIFALENLNPTTYLFAVAVVCQNSLFIGMLFYRRRVISKKLIKNYA